MARFFSLSLFLVCIYINIYPQKYFFRQFSVDRGLPQSTVFSIEEDNWGFLWIGTDGGGICRFNGKEFISYTKSNGVAGNVIRAIHFSDGLIWIGTDGGLSIFNGTNFKNIDESDGLKGTVILNFFQDNNDVWALTNDGGINIINISNPDSFKVTNISYEDGLTSNFITDVIKDDNGNYWVSSLGGLNILKKRNGKIEVFEKLLTVDLGYDIIWDIERTEGDTIWGSTYESGVFYITNCHDLENIHYFSFNQINNTENSRVWKIFYDSNKNLWFATDKDGLCKYKNGKLFKFSTANGFPNNKVLTVFEDHENNIWAGTMESGLVCYTGETFIEYNKNYGIFSGHISCLEEGKGEFMWIGTDEGLSKYKIFNDNTFQIVSFPFDEIFVDLHINDIEVIDENRVWVGTFDNGLYYLDDNSYLKITKDDGLPDNAINCLLYDSHETLWIGTNYGYCLYDKEIFFNLDEDRGLINNEIQTIIEDSKGRIWIGTLGGLVKIDGTRYQDYNEEEGLDELRIFSLTAGFHDNIWIGTFGGGLYKLDINSKSSKPIKKIADNKTLNSNNIYSLKFLNEKLLIVGTDNGFNEVIFDEDLEVKNIINYNKSDGFTGIENNRNAIIKDKQDNIWFGTINGLIKYNRRHQKNNFKPRISISNIKLFYKNINWQDYSDKKHKWFNIPLSPKFKHNENHLTFKINGISYINPEKLYIQYRIPQINNKWSPPYKQNELDFSDLNPDRYEFEARILINGEVQSDVASYEFIIKPPFWKTWWFYMISCFLIIISLVIYIRFRERKLKNEKQRLEKAVKERTKEIEKQKEEITNQRDEIKGQKEILENQKQQITDSILYAKKIQEAVLPHLKILNSYFPENFVLFKPRDYVSGDFYWVGKKNKDFIVAAVDCTGHGVPGAFMSMLGISFLNEIINERESLYPNDILDNLRNKIIHALKQKGAYLETKDGMDISLCSFDNKKGKLFFAGANNPLYIIRNGEIIEYKGDKMPVSIYWDMKPFKLHKIELQKGDMIYLFSDGYSDQFGGPKKRKFMIKNFRELLKKISTLPIVDQKNLLEKTYIDWKGDLDQIDDILVIGIKINSN